MPVYINIDSDEDIAQEDEASMEESQIAQKVLAISKEQVKSIYLGQPLKTYDYSGLANENQDFRFWLDIPNTNISYPVVQSADNDEYLRKTFDGNKRSSGSIFIDANIRDYQKSKNLIIHGHNMKSGSMFGILPSYRNIDFYNRHPLIYLYTPSGVMVYQVFSCYTIPENIDETLVYRIAFETDEEYVSFLESLEQKSEIKTGVDLTSTRSLLTLSTCTNHGGSRFIVHALRYQ